MDDAGILRAHLAHQVGYTDQHDDDEEDEQVSIAEGHDKLRDGVIGHYLRQHLALVYPSKLILLGSQLHPHGVDGVLRYHTNIRHHQQAVLLHGEGINLKMVDVLLRLLLDEHQGVGCHHEIILIGIMMGGREGDGVELLVAILHQCRMLLALGGMAMIATAEHQAEAQHKTENQKAIFLSRKAHSHPFHFHQYSPFHIYRN